jgi:uncharacterized protein (DUF58 family)
MSSGFVPQVKPGGLSVARVTERFAQRGVYPLPSFRLVTSFPFGLLETAASYDDRREIVVYPRVHAVRAAPVTRAASYHARPPARRGEGDEFFSLREYVPGDEVRHIAWKASARASKLLVKELELQTERSVLISFDTRQAPGDDDTGERFEEAVELVASLAVSMLNSEYEVAVATPETLVPMGKGQAHSTNVLEMLARAQPLALGMHGPEGRAADATAALALYVSARPRNWGAALPGGARFLDPREVIHA